MLTDMNRAFARKRGLRNIQRGAHNGAALTICERHPDELAEEMADPLFSLPSLMNLCNQPKAALSYAERQLEQRMKVEMGRSPMRKSRCDSPLRVGFVEYAERSDQRGP